MFAVMPSMASFNLISVSLGLVVDAVVILGTLMD
tara:strand:+ start:4477 stop:4578 length:102 start_codon:yes stop_codon:yes gene_type:complete